MHIYLQIMNDILGLIYSTRTFFLKSLKNDPGIVVILEKKFLVHIRSISHYGKALFYSQNLEYRNYICSYINNTERDMKKNQFSANGGTNLHIAYITTVLITLQMH